MKTEGPQKIAFEIKKEEREGGREPKGRQQEADGPKMFQRISEDLTVLEKGTDAVMLQHG